MFEVRAATEQCHFCRSLLSHSFPSSSGIKDVYGNEQNYCDCGEATFDGNSYAGKFCEAAAVDMCGSAAEYGNVFCTNGGKVGFCFSSRRFHCPAGTGANKTASLVCSVETIG